MHCDINPEFIMRYAIREQALTSFLRQMTFETDSGHGRMWLLALYSGIQVWGIDFHMRALDIRPVGHYHYLKLNYCISGSCEIPLPEERYVYVSRGLLSIDQNPPAGQMLLPTGCYTGLEIVIGLQEMKRGAPCSWREYGIDITGIEAILRPTQGSYLAEASREWGSLAKALFTHLRAADLELEDYRFLLLQLLWLLKSGVQTCKVPGPTFLTLGQREIVLQAHDILTFDLRQRYVIADLAGQLGVSASSLKKYFTLMFGMPISLYLRQRRIDLAKELLAGGSMHIADIAGKVGYENQGKFGTVFRKETGLTPLEYRRRCRLNVTRKEHVYEKTV